MTTSGPGRKAAAQSSAAEGAVPGEERELRLEIEQTRERLGETVEQLVAKADLEGRARAKAAELAGRVRASTARVRRTAMTGAIVAKRHRKPLIAAAATLTAGYLVLRRWGRR